MKETCLRFSLGNSSPRGSREEIPQPKCNEKLTERSVCERETGSCWVACEAAEAPWSQVPCTGAGLPVLDYRCAAPHLA